MDTLEILLNILNILKGKVNIITTTYCLNKLQEVLITYSTWRNELCSVYTVILNRLKIA